MDAIATFLSFDAPTAFALVVAICFAEQFLLTSALVPGSLAVVGLGFAISRGLASPWLIAAVCFGNYCGDLASFLLGSKLGRRLMHCGFIRKAFEKCETRLTNSPWRFLFASRLSPYAKSVGPFAAGVVGFRPGLFLVGNILCASLDALWFTSIGFAGGLFAGSVESFHRIAGLVGGSLLVAVLVLAWRKASAQCPIKLNAPSSRPPKNCMAFAVRCGFGIIPWHLAGWFEDFVGYWRRQELRVAALKCLSAAEAGDLILLARNYASPWGLWTHSALCSGKDRIVHAYSERTLEETAESLPRRDGLLIVRVRCTQEQREAAVKYARDQLGKRFKLCSTKPKTDGPATFNCAGLCWAAYHFGAGINIAQDSGTWVTPTDLAESPCVEIVCQAIGGQVFEGAAMPVCKRSGLFAHIIELLGTTLEARLKRIRLPRLAHFLSLLK